MNVQTGNKSSKWHWVKTSALVSVDKKIFTSPLKGAFSSHVGLLFNQFRSLNWQTLLDEEWNILECPQSIHLPWLNLSTLESTRGDLRLALSWKVVVLKINTITGEGIHVVWLMPDDEMMSRILIPFFAYRSTSLPPILTPILQTEAISTRAQKIKLRSAAFSNHVEIEQLKAACTRYYKGPWVCPVLGRPMPCHKWL